MRRLFSIGSALILVFAMAGTVLGWSDPNLQAKCAPDANHYAWSMVLPTESNYNMQFSWESDFLPLLASPPAGPFQSGLNEFTTDRGGTTLFVRFASDHNASDSAAANAELCEPPVVTPTPTPSPTPVVTPTPTPVVTPSPTPSPSPEGTVSGGTGTPAATPVASIPDSALGGSATTPLATIVFGLVLVASLGALAFVNVRSVRH